MATTKLFTVEDLWRMPTDEPWQLWDKELRNVQLRVAPQAHSLETCSL